ncbi:MAG: serine/threonine-protein kinase [candidate division Zixibacteria bacterium]|nr:serine/threonine-protein kinase [candidate division Zixibacteria bacterium]
MLADFGIAQIFNKANYEATKSDVIMGTLAYMSPEQRESSFNVDITTDIFSMGIIIYEILVGKRPVGRFKLPSEINSQISKRFDDIIVRSLAANPKDRYQTAVELKDDILDAISGRSWPGVGLWHSMVGVESFIGKCQFLDMIRESKFSSTMLVENKETHELYVIKKNEKYFIGLKEAKLLTKLKHENILNVYGAGGDRNRLVIVIEYAQGGSLADRMVKTYPYEKAMEVICQVAEGLNFAHKNGIIHGNLRPSNILFTRDEKVKVADFGLPPHYSKTTDKNWYAPPERRNNKQGDIYALGVILHQMVFGKNPIYDRSGRLFLGHLQKTIPAKLYAILSKSLSIRMSLRYRGIEEFIYEWEEFRNSLAKIEKPLTPPASFAKSRNQNRMLEIGIIAAGVIIIILLILLFSK